MIPRLLGRASARLRRRESLAAIGGLALALALGVAFLPGVFVESAFRPLSEAVAGPRFVGLLGLLAGALAALSLRRGAVDDEPADPWVPDAVPERAHYDDHRTAGSEIDEVFDADLDERRHLDARRDTARGRVRETAVRAVAAAENCDRETAAERVREGTWTDDPRAAAFLGGAHHAPLGVRIRDWASGERFERWATHAVDEIAALDREGRR